MQAKLKVKLLTHTPNAEEIVATAAKLCYSELGIEDIRESLSKEETKKFLDILVKMGHESPVEHISFTFGIEGVSRSLTHQLVRHRLASYSQKSQRYVKEGQFEYVVPPEIAKNAYAKKIYIQHMHKTQDVYDDLAYVLMCDKIKEQAEIGSIEVNSEEFNWLDDIKSQNSKLYSQLEKEAIEDARYILPNACETKIVATFNARELLHLFKVRCCNRAQWEIREMATEMLMLVREVAPTIFKYAGPNCLNRPCPEGSMTCGEIEAVRGKFKA